MYGILRDIFFFFFFFFSFFFFRLHFSRTILHISSFVIHRGHDWLGSTFLLRVHRYVTLGLEFK